jgi:hypothetical protein
MAIEAARQRAIEMNLSIDGYDLRQISVSQALVVPEPSGQVEVMLCMKPYPESSRSSSGTWDEFFVYSASDTGEWVEHCRGHISVRQSTLLNVVDGQRQKEMTRSAHARQRFGAELECTRIVRSSELYSQCAKVGLEYGPIFANMTEARVGDAGGNPACLRSIGTVIHPDIEKAMPANYHSPFVIHPATLDAFFHVTVAGIAASKGIKSVAVPTFISSVFVSSNLSSKPQHEFSVYATIDGGGQRNSNFDLDVYDRNADPDFPSLEVHGFQLTSLSGQQGEKSIRGLRKSYYRTKLRPDVSLLSPPQFSALCSHLQPTSEDSQLALLIDEALYYMADEAIKQIPENVVSILSSKGVKLYRSLQRIVEYVAGGRLSYDLSSWVTKNHTEREVILKKVRSSGDEGNFAVIVGEQFQGIIQGTVDPLALTMKDDALGRYYAKNSRMARQWYVKKHSTPQVDRRFKKLC